MMDTDAIYHSVCAYGAAKAARCTFDAWDHIDAVKRLLNEADAERQELLATNERLVDEVAELKAAYESQFKELHELKAKLTDKASLLRGCYARIDKLEKALSFYADPIRYQGPNQRAEPGDKWTPEDAAPYRQDVSRDNGSIARAALEKKHEST